MKPEEQRIAIAEACGWTPTPNGHYTMDPAGLGGQFVHPLNLPNYLNDLNAMHEAEKVLIAMDDGRNAGSTRYLYAANLYNLVPIGQQPITATAAQRAEAFLKTLNLWKEEAL